MTDAPTPLSVVQGRRPEDVSAEMASRIKALVYEYEGCTTVAATLGVLQIVAREILEEQSDE